METIEGQNMNWTKEEVFALMDEKKRIEKEMAEWTEVLNNEGGVGLHEPLVDEEGNLYTCYQTMPSYFLLNIQFANASW